MDNLKRSSRKVKGEGESPGGNLLVGEYSSSPESVARALYISWGKSQKGVLLF